MYVYLLVIADVACTDSTNLPNANLPNVQKTVQQITGNYHNGP